VVVVLYDGFQSLDAFGPIEVLGGAPRAYEVTVVAPRAGAVRASNGISVNVERGISDVTGSIDTLLVAGGDGTRTAVTDPDVVDAVRTLAGRARRVASVCSGSFLLAAAGVLDGRRATTHWAWCDELRRRYPAVTVESDPIYVRDGEVWTSAGVTAGIDLALALVEDDLGSATARRIAQQLVVYLHRPGGQSQFSAALAGQRAAPRPALRELLAWIRENPTSDCSVHALAEITGTSERSLARMFRAELDTTPADMVESIRLEAVRTDLETTTLTISAIARRCGFGTAETLHRAFQRRLRITPADYRARFRARAA